jgi:hypothetical protein
MFAIDCVADRANERFGGVVAFGEAILGAKLDSIQDHVGVIECAEYDYRYRWRFGLQTRDTIEIQRAGQGETEKDDVDSALTQALQPRFEPIDMFYFESAIRDRQRLAH